MNEIDPPEDINSVDDIESFLGELAEQHNELVREVERIDNLVIRALDNYHDTSDDLEELRGEVNRLRDQVEIVDATMPDQQKGKLEKVRSILEFAMDHGSGGMRGVKVDSGEAAAAAGSSRDTACRLMDEVGATFSWADVETPGGPKPKVLKLAIQDREVGELMDDVRAHYGGGAEA